MSQETLLPNRASNAAHAHGQATPRKRQPRLVRYLAIFLAPAIVAALILGVIYGFLVRVQETIGPVTAARLQDSTGELYGAALVYRPFAYKLERYRLKSPDILLLGSSRVMPFAGEVFTTSVVNAGGGANTIEQARDFLRAAIAAHKPKSILLGLDFWWFNPNRDSEIGTTSELSDDVEISLPQLVMPATWVSEGRITLGALLAALLPTTELPQGIGAFAKLSRRGWDVYGRYDYGNLLDGGIPSDDRKFKGSLKRLAKTKKSSKFNVHVAPSPESLQVLREIVAEMEAQSIELTLLVPPLAGPLRDALDRDPDNRLIPLWRDALADLGVRVFDFTDTTPIGSPDCEFLDAFHGGEVTYLRMLDAIANFGGSTLAKSIDRDMVAGLIATNAGHARIAELRPAGIAPEVDFLDLGCSKSR
jgi:hypothetical protein